MLRSLHLIQLRVAVIAGLALLLIAGLLAVTTYYWVQIPFLKFTLQAGQCKWGPPLAGVYLSGRLRLLDRCRTVSGTTPYMTNEATDQSAGTV